MSVIRKKPYIEALLATMSDANLKDLHVVLNSGGDNVNLDFEHLTNDYKNKVTPVYFQLEDCNLKTGILIWTNSKCALICYHRFQDLVIYELSPTYHTFTKINEYCDINELRRVLDDTLETKGTIESGDAEEGTLPFADGEGGATWDKPVDYIKGSDFPEGSTSVKMIAIDDDGNLVKVDIPEGTVVVDSALSDSSENPVQNKIIDAALTEIEGDVSDIETALETKANVDGNYPTMTVGAADNLTPYDESAGDDQDDPFSFQATGTGNGSQTDFATGALALMKEKRGNSVVVNQRLDKTNLPATQEIHGITFTNEGNGVYTLNGTADDYVDLVLSGTIYGNGHTWMGMTCSNNVEARFDVIGGDYGFYTNTISGESRFYIRVNPGVTLTNEKVYANVINLTQWFGSNDAIPADLLAHPENFFRYYQGSLAYNAGQIVNANSQYIKCIGRQQWDEEAEVGGIDTTTGANDNSVTNAIRSKNYIRVIPNTTYYTKCPAGQGGRYFYYDENKNFIEAKYLSENNTFVIPNNCAFVRFTMSSLYGTTYNHDITISLYYEGESGYDQYYPYEVLTNNDTGTEELKSAGSVADSKAPDGTITRKVGIVDLGTLTWNYEGSNHLFNASLLLGKTTTNLLCKLYMPHELSGSGNDPDKCIFVYQTTLYITNSDYTDSATFKAAMSGVTLYYELAEPTTEQGTPFSENLIIDDFGSMEFAGTSGVPQGNLIFYPVDYKAFIDTLYDYTEGTPSELVKQSDLSAVSGKADDIYAIMKENVGGILRHQLAESASIAFNDTKYCDLGDLTWTYYNSQYFTATITDLKVGTGDHANDLLCPVYNQSTNNANMNLWANNKSVWIKNDSYTDATTFKNAMKGVLLAYEKASE